MFKIVRKRELAPKIKLYEIEAPEIARKARPGQFVILRVREEGERVPLTITDYKAENGTVTVVFQEVGRTTKFLGTLKEGEGIPDIVGPLGRPAEIERFGRVLCIGGGVMAAPITLQEKALKEKGNYVIGVLAARNKDLVIFEEETKAVTDEFYLSTDDGSRGHQGIDFVAEILDKNVDRVIVMGHVALMKRVCEMTKPRGIKTMVDLMPIMVDGMGMCGACRVHVGGETKFACVDGPEFDGHEVDFDELVRRQRMYTPEEKIASVMYEKLGGFKLGKA